VLGEYEMNNKFECGLLKYFNKDDLNKIRSVKIGIAGAGGPGSNCAMNLVRCGFDNFIIMDFDKIDASNLNRQFYFAEQIGMLKTEALKQNLKRINPDVKIEASKQSDVVLTYVLDDLPDKNGQVGIKNE